MNDAWKRIFADYVEGFKAIQTLERIGIFDEEEKAIHEHNLLCEIVNEMKREIEE